MELFLIRHAEAAPLGEGGVVEDANRPLTPRGETQCKSLAAGFESRQIRLGEVVTSPLLRARQTAEGMLHAWQGPAPDLRTCEDLAPGGKRRRVARFLRDLGTDAVGLVGHQPDLGMLAGWLIGSKKAQIEIPKAGILCISCPDRPGKGRGHLSWLLPPEWFEA